jgi:hypothetical protein
MWDASKASFLQRVPSFVLAHGEDLSFLVLTGGPLDVPSTLLLCMLRQANTFGCPSVGHSMLSITYRHSMFRHALDSHSRIDTSPRKGAQKDLCAASEVGVQPFPMNHVHHNPCPAAVPYESSRSW